MKKVSARINELKGDRSVCAFARLIGMRQQTVDNYISLRQKPSLLFVDAVCRRCGVSAEEKRVLAAARKLGHDWYLASLISRWTGQRYGDVARLDWSQVDLKARTIAFVPSKTAKHGVRVVSPIGDVLLAALKARAKEKGTEGFVLPEHAITYPHPFLPAVAFSRALEAAGLDIKRFTFHSWRHTFRTRLAEAGVSDDLARRLGGWTNEAMAAHYDHSSRLAELLRAVNSAW